MEKRKKIMKTLQECPGGCTITDLAQRTGINATLISTLIEDFIARGEVKCRQIGQAKLITV